MTPCVKICGITRLDDARLAVELGAAAIGFNFWEKSPRAIDVAGARKMARELPPAVLRVGVFVNASPDDVADVVRQVGLTVVQLHGDERPEDFARVGAALFKRTSLDEDETIETATSWLGDVTPLVDARDRIRRGGTGRTADWARAAILSERRAIVLAGGLTPHNVADAIARVRPWAVDVSSGVEERPGMKSEVKLREFFDAVSAAGRGNQP